MKVSGLMVRKMVVESMKTRVPLTTMKDNGKMGRRKVMGIFIFKIIVFLKELL